MMEPHRLSLAEASRMIRDGRLTSMRLAESLLDRIEHLEPVVEAWVTVDRDAVMVAAEVAAMEAEDEG